MVFVNALEQSSNAVLKFLKNLLLGRAVFAVIRMITAVGSFCCMATMTQHSFLTRVCKAVRKALKLFQSESTVKHMYVQMHCCSVC